MQVLENVSFVYQMRPQDKVLNGINLTIEGGTTVAFVGKSGGGKSTLMHLLMRFYDPTAGQITLDGLRLSDINLRSLHMHTGLVAQVHNCALSQLSDQRIQFCLSLL